MLHHVYSSKIRRHFPSRVFFLRMEEEMMKGEQSKIFIVTYKDKIIGGSACIYSEDSAYLWFSGGMRKTYALQYPGILAVWYALFDAKQRGYRHLEFMDVGLPSASTVTANLSYASAVNKAVPAAGFFSAGSG